jgi:hypothetical protein
MKGRYFHDISIVRARGDNNAPLPEANEVVIFRSFMKVGLRFPLDKLLVEVLKTFKIFLHQLTPRGYHQNEDFYLGHEKPGVRTKCKIFLQYSRIIVRDEGHMQRTISQ